MTRDRQDRILAYLARAGTWVTAGELADVLGVTPRSIRSYVTAIKARAAGQSVVEAGPNGYRVDADAYAAFRSAAVVDVTETPRDRLYGIVRRLVDSPDGLDVFDLADSLHVSESTVESDLARVRLLLSEAELSLTRRGGTVALAGTELARRRLLSRMFREETERGMIELEAIQREFSFQSLSEFKTALIDMLTERNYSLNDYGIDNVLLHIAIAVDRVSKDRHVPESDTGAGEPADGIPSDLSALIAHHFDTVLGAADIDYLAYLLTTRAVMRAPDATDPGYLNRADLDVVRSIVQNAGEEYLVDLSDEDFITRLTLHVQNLLRRAHEHSYSRNPMARSIKTSYPMIYELAVYIASRLQQHGAVEINDDEIAYIAMHVGAHLQQQQSRSDEVLRCVLVCPNYYDMHLLLRDRVTLMLGDAIEVVRVVTRSDVSWAGLDADIVLTTIEPPVPDEKVLVIQPFFTQGDADRVRQAVSRIRRVHRRALIKDEVLKYFDASLFLRNEGASSEAAMIRRLGDLMVARGIIDEDYVDGAIERERMSSTAFTDSLAVPHAMEMTARSTSIAIAVNESSMPWGENRVNVVALIAFSASERANFQRVFDQFVEVFSEREDVQRIVRRSTDFTAFIDELVHTMDS
ncbi:transcription antiterminator [Mycetocola manganoxydans]|uniref:Transcription antiterminator n=1 Tax=Mycetocola manganoxydans TaxID=699879 RepID=A0A3L6ZVV4_9MICO|nr:PRD domain-containing protein [Mycetocola manganoxydans]RLP71999.1 transcription antiterminator [Mycetocola manganoxydans]GHD47470.1 transcriptional antiterminator [Mycetocola manganoxydans]